MMPVTNYKLAGDKLRDLIMSSMGVPLYMLVGDAAHTSCRELVRLEMRIGMEAAETVLRRRFAKLFPVPTYNKEVFLYLLPLGKKAYTCKESPVVFEWEDVT